MSKVLQVCVTCSNGYFDEHHRYFVPIHRVIDWCDDKYGVRKLNKDIEVVGVSLLDANHNLIEIENAREEVSNPIVESSNGLEVSEKESALIAAMRDIGTYDDDLTLSDSFLFDKEDISFPVGSVDPDDHWE